MKKRSSALSSSISMLPQLVHGKMVGFVFHVRLEVEGSFCAGKSLCTAVRHPLLLNGQWLSKGWRECQGLLTGFCDEGSAPQALRE